MDNYQPGRRGPAKPEKAFQRPPASQNRTMRAADTATLYAGVRMKRLGGTSALGAKSGTHKNDPTQNLSLGAWIRDCRRCNHGTGADGLPKRYR